MAFFALAVAAGLSFTPARARGDEAAAEESLGPTSAQTRALLESGRAGALVEEPETDLHAAQTMPHRNLERGEALELAEAVFEPEIEAAAGIYGEMEPEKFLSDHAAVVPISSLPEEPGQPEEGLPAERPNLPVLVESILPLRTENASGEPEAVDLGLERSEGELLPQNPLSEVEIPDQVGEGISLPGPDVEITISGAPENRVATDAGGEFAFYPEVAEDSDLIVSPTSEGVETMVDVRSVEAPMRMSYDLTLPPGADLRPTKEGGAEVVEGDRTTLLIPPPTATDAAGDPVQTELTVSGESIAVGIRPTPSTSFPTLVDPTFIAEGWRWTLNHESMAAWSPMTTNAGAMDPWPYERWNPNWYPGLDLTSGVGGNAHWGDNANWEYWVPRYREDLARYGTAPSTWIYQLNTEGLLFLPWGSTANYPALVLGLVDPVHGWEVSGVHYGGQGEMNNWSNFFSFTNEYEQTNDKGADMNLVTYEEEDPAKLRDTYMADAYIDVVDTDAPRILELNPPAAWTNGTSWAIPYTFEDGGLGVRSAEINRPGETNFHPGWGVNFICLGIVEYPCPRKVSSTEAGRPNLGFDPDELPTGRDPLVVTVGDPLWTAGHVASGTVIVKVDHTAPELSLSGSLTEQVSVGTRRPTYALRVNARDGVEGAPQSGVKKAEVFVDGKKVLLPEITEWEPNCQTQNCPLNDEWTMNASEYGAGPHEVQVIATDAAGNTTTKTLHVELQPTLPSLSVSGSLTEQATLGTERPSYELAINASTSTESATPAAIPTYSSSFGSAGTGNGQFTRPGAMAIDAQGNLWVADSNDNRIEEFNEKGEYLRQFGTKGSANGQLNHPTAIAIAANGNLWVADSFNKRVEEFSPTGTYLAKFGSAGTGNGQFAGSGPEAIAIDYHGNIWVADTYGGRIEKFDENGVFIRSVATKGKGPEQLGQPDGIAIGPGGNAFVADWEDDKVAEYAEGGKFIRQFGSQGTEAGQLENPTGIAVDSRGDVWVPDQNNGRIEEFNQGGEYLGRFGDKGTGVGQFELSYPTGMVTDTKGDIWVTDAGDNRVEKWVSANYQVPAGPALVRAFRSTAPFFEADGMAPDAKGDLWAATDSEHLVEFGPKGEQLLTRGSFGPGGGQFEAALPVAISGGHVWVGDLDNHRIERYGETGTLQALFQPSVAPLALAAGGNHLWVASGGRVTELTETGAVVRSFGTEGTGAGQFKGDYGIAIGPDGHIWVSDSGNHRVEEFSETGEFIRQVGGGTGVTELAFPSGVYVDPAGDLWVLDHGHRRVVEFSPSGEYMRSIGELESGELQTTFPNFGNLTGDGHGDLWVADAGSQKIEEWEIPPTHSQISVEITVDGKRVEALEDGCEADSCSSTDEWTLQSSSLSPGSHEVVVRATDGLGNTTSKTLNIKVGDAVKPSLEVGGELASAPEGWIEQAEGDYGLHANATDSGYGVTSLTFSLDGKILAQKEQSCPTGACSASISTTINAHELSAGAHPAEVVATDRAGNTASKAWNVNVDPDGAVTTEELAATAEALEETSGSLVLAATKEIPGVEGSTSGVGLTEIPEDPAALRATGTYVPMEVGKTPEEGFDLYADGLPDLVVACDEVEEPEEECVPRADLEAAMVKEEEEIAAGLKHPGMIPITVIPVATPGSAEEVALANGQAAVAANAAGEEADTVTRPMSDGGLSFADIRGPSAPEHYAYEMDLSPELQLRQPDPEHIEAFYREYGITAFVITAEPAHDAIGTTVPTHLSISGPAKITLTVEHRAQSPAGGGFVYPVMGGTGWQGGYRTISVELTEPPPPPPGEESRPAEAEETVVGPPEPSTPQAAGVTNLAMLRTTANNTTRHRIRWIRCEHRWEPAPYSPRVNTEHPCGNPFTREEAAEEFAFNFGIASYIYVSPGNFVRHRPGAETDVECAKELFPSHWNGVLIEVAWFINPAEQCQWWPVSNGNGGEEVGPGHHLCLYGEWNAGEGNPGEWATFQVGSAMWIESIHGGEGYEVSRHKTTLHKCN